MTVGQLLDRVRHTYVETLAAAVAGAGAGGVAEPLLMDGDGRPVSDGVLQVPCRVDLVVVRDGLAGSQQRVDATRLVEFDEIAFDWDSGLEVTLTPFSWDYVQLDLDALVDHRELKTWFEQWCQLEDVREPGPDGLFGVVHFISDPKRAGSSWRLFVDLGSAPVKAFEQLLDAVERSGARRVRVGREAA